MEWLCVAGEVRERRVRFGVMMAIGEMVLFVVCYPVYCYEGI